MTARRRVVVLPAFFDRLDELLPPERTADGSPSTADFVLHELTNIVETLAVDYEAVTIPLPGETSRLMVVSGVLVSEIAVYVDLTASGAVELYWLDLRP